MTTSNSAERGYVYQWPSGDTNVSAVLHHTLKLSVEVDAHPAPTVQWTRENQTAATKTAIAKTTHLTGSRSVMRKFVTDTWFTQTELS